MSKLKTAIPSLLKQLAIVTFSLFLLGISINMFLAPHHIAAGGVSGIGVLVESATGISRSITVLVLNVVMLILAYIFLGRKVFAKILLGSLLLPVALALVPEMMLVSDRLISILFGSALFGVGVALLYRNNSSSGGTTIPPLILKKYFGLNTSIGLLITDTIIVIFNIFVFGLESFFWAILSLIITSVVMSYIETGFGRKRVMMITSRGHLPEIAQAALSEGHRKVRLFETHDSFRQVDDKTLMLLMDSFEYPGMVKVIQQIDPQVLIITYNVSEVHGLDYIAKEKEIMEKEIVNL